MKTSKGELDKAQASYKKNFDARLTKSRDSLRVGSFAFVRKDYSNPRDDTRHKLAARVYGPFQVHSVNEHTDVLRMGDNLERISLDRVTPALSPVENEPETTNHGNDLDNTSNALNGLADLPRALFAPRA